MAHDRARADAASTLTVDRMLSTVRRWVVVEIVVFVLVVVSAARTLHYANTDMLLPSLISTQRLTWFYWGQDRLANVVPLVASPIDNVGWNLSFQVMLVGLGWFVLAALFAANHLRGRGVPVRPSIVALATLTCGGATWAALPAVTEHVLVFEQLYAFSLLVFVLGLIALTRASWVSRATGAAAVLVATLINPSLLLYAPAVVLLPGVTAFRSNGKLPIPTAQLLVPLGVAVSAFVVTSMASARFGHHPAAPTGYNQFSFAAMRRNVGEALGNVGSSLRGAPVLLLVVAALLLLAARVNLVERRLRWTYLLAPVFALLWTFVFSGNTWVVANQLYPRYFFPVYAVGLMVVAGAGAELFDAIASSRRLPLFTGRAPAAARPMSVTGTLAVAAAVVVPLISLMLVDRVPIDALERAKPVVRDIKQLDVDFAVGSYWATWPVVIEARAQGLDILGVTARSEATVSMIVDRIANDIGANNAVTVLCTDFDAETCAATVARLAPVAVQTGSMISAAPLVIELVPTNH